MIHNLNRRSVLKTGTMAGAAATLPGFLAREASAQSATLSVFSPLPPDPAPPGAAKF
jgi:multiple sugar transport system substrate-binding protein